MHTMHPIAMQPRQVLAARLGRQQQQIRLLRQRQLRTVLATASTPVTERARPGEKKGFVEEMRFVAMRLHTKDQAPKEGGKEASKTPMAAWQPTLEGYLQFLSESKVVFDALEKIAEAQPEYAQFRNTGLERGAALQQDIDFLCKQYNLTAPQPAADGPGNTYAQLLQKLAKEDPPAFICHYYNVYFAHTAGGRMIGSKLSGMLLEGKELAFYQYDGDMKELLQAVRDRLNEVADTWSREEKDHCLEETEKSFKYSGALMKTLMGGAGGH